MVGRFPALSLVLALWAGGLALPAVPAAAQCRLCAESPSAAVTSDEAPPPLALEVETSLDFDRLILIGTGPGAARLSPQGERSATGSLASINGRAAIGQIVIRGEPGRPVSVDLPESVELRGLKGGVLRIDSLLSDLSRDPILDSSGRLVIRFGGELHVDGELDGDFRGDFTVRVDYL